MLLIGLMSGTSADGIDAALVEIDGEGRGTHVRLVAHRHRPFRDDTREAILAVCAGREPLERLSTLHFALGDLFYAAAADVAEEAGIPLAQIDAIACHGQTVWHQPLEM